MKRIMLLSMLNISIYLIHSKLGREIYVQSIYEFAANTTQMILDKNLNQVMLTVQESKLIIGGQSDRLNSVEPT